MSTLPPCSRLTAGVWMSRSSLVWGPFSVVWGLALALTTVLLRQNQDKSDRYLFVFGTVMGGVNKARNSRCKQQVAY